MVHKFNAKQLNHPAAQALVAALVLLLGAGQTLVLSVRAQNSRSGAPKQKNSKLSDERRAALVLSRLTFGTRPGDFEHVKTIGVDAFIDQQLDPDAIDDTALAAKLGKLPTLALATPVLIEQYTPPKPAPLPSPTPATPTNTTAASQNASNQNAASSQQKTEAARMPALPGEAAMKMGKLESQTAANEQKPGAEEMTKPADSAHKTDASQVKPAAPKAMPPPKNPQMVVTELQRAALLRAVYSERQLYEVMVDFWENHFSIFANKDADRYLLTSFDRDTIRPFAFGRFRDLLGATAHSPAMLFYLDNWRSSVARPYQATKDKPAGIDGGLNENYARELMELHTMGVDGGYTQKDVQEVARCFSGWTIQKPNEEGLFLYRPGLHDKGEKIVLGHKILAGGGIADGERVLDILATHPATAHFIALKLARRFISDDPPQPVIDRAAQVFLQTDGSIRETLRAIVTAPEFFSPVAYRAKIRSPFEYVVAAMRALNVETDADAAVPGWIARMGQPLFGRITPDGYPDRAEQWLSAGAMLARFNFANALATNGIKGTRIDPARWLGNADLNDPRAIADRLTSLLLAGDVSPQTREAMDKIAWKDPARTGELSSELTGVNYSGASVTQKTTSTLPPYVAQLITMVIGSPEFQRR
jgi:uncharacterized protein (DUF1800 family)